MIIKRAKLEWTCIKSPNSMSGKYQTNIIMSEADAKPYMAELDKVWEEGKGSTKTKPQSKGYTYILDDNDNKTGEVKFIPKQAPQSRDGKYTFTVSVYDAKARKLDTIPDIGNGTIANVDVRPYIYDTGSAKGVTLNLNAIQILDLVEYVADSEPTFGEEEGFEAEETNVNAFKPEGL